LLGASGSGKSSLVQAGIIPYLADEWGVSKLERFTCVPDINPFASLYNCLPNEYKINGNPLGKENQNPNNNRQLIEFIDNFKKVPIDGLSLSISLKKSLPVPPLSPNEMDL